MALVNSVEDFNQLLSTFSCTEDDLGRSLPELPVGVDGRVLKILKREVPELFQRLGGGYLSGCDLIE